MNAAVRLVPITDTKDPGLADYVRLTDVVLRSKHEPARRLFIAEGANVIRRALAAGHLPRSFVMAHKWVGPLRDVLERFPEVPVYVGDENQLEEITGFHVHRGALAAMHRPPLRNVDELLASARGGRGARRVVVLEDIVDHTNVGAVFRSAAALDVDAVLVSPRCADPLYRRSVKVSMGTVFQVPWTRMKHGPKTGAEEPDGIALLKELGFTIAGLALSQDSVNLDVFAANPPDKLALVLGAEGDGLEQDTIAVCDLTVRIPMAGGVDSLNVAAASAVAFWATRVREHRDERD